MREATIREAQTPEDLEAVQKVLRDEVDRWGFDPTFGGVEAEIAALPEVYSPPHGAALLATGSDGMVQGAGAMRPLPGPGDCQLTALVVDAPARSRGVGRLLLQALVRRARAAGHRQMHLDTAAEDPVAMALWQEAGFVPSPPYFPNPLPGMQHMVLDLTQLG